jgi:MoaA/NifB/PqqE/SkfB family radical SAM enzyme
MEPTLDNRLCDLMLMVANSPANPKHMFMLQTNGILLDKHDHQKMRKAGLTHLSVSVDAAEPETQKMLRSGTSLQRVISNVKSFHHACPEVEIIFITTVTMANIHKIEELVNLGIELGVNQFVVREVFYHPDNDIVDHQKMPDLLLRDGDFFNMKNGLLEKFGTSVNFLFANNEELKAGESKMREDSLL